MHRDTKQKRGYVLLVEGENWGLLFNGYSISVWDNEKVLGMYSGDGCTKLNLLNVTELYT